MHRQPGPSSSPRFRPGRQKGRRRCEGRLIPSPVRSPLTRFRSAESRHRAHLNQYLTQLKRQPSGLCCSWPKRNYTPQQQQQVSERAREEQHENDAWNCQETFDSMAAMISSASGSTVGRKRVTEPSAPTRNFSKFHCTSPASPAASATAVSSA